MFETKLEKTWMAGMFGVVLLIASVAQQAVAASACNAPTVLHNDSVSSRCCQTTICPPGSQPNICSSEGTSATCEKCLDGRFNDMNLSSAPPSGKMDSCKWFTIICYPNDYTEVFAGNATHDRICDCNNDLLLGADGKCHTPCSPGKYWLKDQSKCFPCPNGTFKNATGGQECSNCTECNVATMECNSTHDAVCQQEIIEQHSKGSENELTPGKIAASVVVPLFIVLVAVFVILYCKRCRKSSSSSSNQASSSNSPPSSDPPPSSRPNGTASENPEDVPLLENGHANANDTTSSRRQSGSIHGTDGQPSGVGSTLGGPLPGVPPPGGPPPGGPPPGGSDGQPLEIGPVVNLGGPPPGGSDGQPSGVEPVVNLGGGSDGQPSGVEPVVNLSGGSDGQPSGVEPVVNLGGGSDGQPSVGPVVSLGGPLPGGSNGQPSGHGPLSGRRPPIGSGSQPASIEARPNDNVSDPASRGDDGSGQDQRLHSGNEMPSLCSYNPSIGDRPLSQVARNSFNPPSTDWRDSGQSTIPETSSFDLQSDDAPTEESIVKKYVMVMRRNHVNALRMLHVGVTFIGYLYQEHILTPDQYSDILIIKKQPGGNPEIFKIIQDALLRSGDKAAKPFLDALIHPDSRQDALAMLIDPERATELIRKRDHPDEDLSPEPDKSSVGERSGPLLSPRSVDQDIVDHSKPADTVHTETPVKVVDTGESWVDPAAPASKC